MRKPQSDVPATPVIQVIERMFSLIDVLASREEAISLKAVSYTHLTLPTNREV